MKSFLVFSLACVLCGSSSLFGQGCFEPVEVDCTTLVPGTPCPEKFCVGTGQRGPYGNWWLYVCGGLYDPQTGADSSENSVWGKTPAGSGLPGWNSWTNGSVVNCGQSQTCTCEMQLAPDLEDVNCEVGSSEDVLYVNTTPVGNTNCTGAGTGGGPG